MAIAEAQKLRKEREEEKARQEKLEKELALDKEKLQLKEIEVVKYKT